MLFLWLFLTLIIVWHKCGQRFFFISCMKNTTVRWWSELQQKSAWLPHRYLPHLPPLHRINTCINVTTSAAGVKSSLVWKNQKFTNKGNVSKRRCPLHHFLSGLHDLRVVCQQNSDDSQNYRLTHIKPKKCVSDTWFKKKKNRSPMSIYSNLTWHVRIKVYLPTVAYLFLSSDTRGSLSESFFLNITDFLGGYQLLKNENKKNKKSSKRQKKNNQNAQTETKTERFKT